MLWFLLIPALLVLVPVVFFAPDAVRYLVAFVRFQFEQMSYSMLIFGMRMSIYWHRKAAQWQRWRIYRRSVRAMDHTSRDIASDFHKHMKEIYRDW